MGSSQRGATAATGEQGYNVDAAYQDSRQTQRQRRVIGINAAKNYRSQAGDSVYHLFYDTAVRVATSARANNVCRLAKSSN